MKQLLMTMAVLLSSCVMADSEIVDGIEWWYRIRDGKAFVGGDGYFSAVPYSTTGAVSIPLTLGECPVMGITDYAFEDCNGLTSVTIPSSVTSIGEFAFDRCSSLTNMTIPSSVTSVGIGAFYYCSGLTRITIPQSITNIGRFAFADCCGLTNLAIAEGVTTISEGMFGDCVGLTSITIPSSVTNIGSQAFQCCSKLESVEIGASVSSIGANCFYSCINLTNVTFQGNAPTEVGGQVFSDTSLDLNIVVPVGSIGWDWDKTSTKLPTRWPYNTETGRRIRHVGNAPILSDNGTQTLTVTNVVVHYVVNSVQPEKVIPASMDTGFVNIITEVKSGGAVSVPTTWAENYPNYVAKFGSGFTKSLMKPTGKKDGSGNAMLVWQDYVAGTDPTDEEDVFTASITMDANGKLIISYNPELSDDEKAKRIYKTFGKTKLTDSDWVEVPTGHEADYNFFKVTVEMK